MLEGTLEVASGTTAQVTLLPVKPKEEAPVAVAIDSVPPGAQLTVDGKPAGPAPVKLSLVPGGHEVLAELAGHQLSRSELVVTAGRERSVTVTLVPVVVAVAPRKFPVGGAVLVGAGLVAGAAAVWFDLQAQAAAKQVSALYVAGGTWDASARTLEASGERSQTLMYGTAAAGGLALAGGLVWIVVSLFSSPGDAPAPHASTFFFIPTPTGATAAWSARF